NKKTALSWYSVGDIALAGACGPPASSKADRTNQTAGKVFRPRFAHLGAKTLRSAIEPFRTRRVLFPGARPERQIQCGVREGDFDQRWRIPAWDSDARPGAHPTPHRPGRTDWRCDLHSETMRPIR